MKVGIIGSSGFIGRNLCDLFVKNSRGEIVVWNRKVHGNFLSKKDREIFLDSNELNLVYQLAWASIEDEKYRQNPQNVFFTEATIEFVNSCIQRELRTIVIGTASKTMADLNDEYLRSKEVLRNGILEINNSWVTLARPTFVFSIEERRPHIFRTFMKWLEHGHKLEDFPMNYPKREIDFVHVRDVAESLYRFADDSLCHSEVVIGSGLSISIKDAIRLLHQHFVGSSASTFPIPFSPTMFDPNTVTLTFNANTLRFYGLA